MGKHFVTYIYYGRDYERFTYFYDLCCNLIIPTGILILQQIYYFVYFFQGGVRPTYIFKWLIKVFK